jgi:ABC-type Fe3+ transport system permease subunit
MSERELRNALLRGEHPIDLQALTERVLRRDRRRIWFSGIACIVAWMLVVMLPWSTILPMLAKVGQHMADPHPNSSPTTAEQQAQLIELSRIMKEGTIATFIGSVASMFIAALFTVSFIVFSRRATLRQVNARLGEISAQLKLLTKDLK